MMKNFVWVLMLSVLSLVAFPHIALAQDHYDRAHYKSERSLEDREAKRQHREQRGKDRERSREHKKQHWKAGSTLPQEYGYQSQVDYRHHGKLSRPARSQQWVKVNGQYVLMNVLTNTVIKVVPE